MEPGNKKIKYLVSDSVNKYGANSVGVYVVSYDEITPILIQSPLYETLGKVRWYGSDSIAQNHHVTKNGDSALFAMQTNFANPLFIGSEAGKALDLKKNWKRSCMRQVRYHIQQQPMIPIG